MGTSAAICATSPGLHIAAITADNLFLSLWYSILNLALVLYSDWAGVCTLQHSLELLPLSRAWWSPLPDSKARNSTGIFSVERPRAVRTLTAKLLSQPPLQACWTLSGMLSSTFTAFESTYALVAHPRQRRSYVLPPHASLELRARGVGVRGRASARSVGRALAGARPCEALQIVPGHLLGAVL